MICNCNELCPWLKKEINHLENILKNSNQSAIFYQTIKGKIEAYSLILECFEND